MLRCGIAIPYGSSIFNCLRRLSTVFHSGCTNLHFYQKYTEYIFLHILASTCYLLSFDTNHSDKCEVICTSLMIGDVEHLSRYLLAICISSLEKMSIHILCPLFNQIILPFFFFLVLSCMCSFCVLDINPLAIWFVIFSFIP